jgi:hypothetical protein
MLAGCPLDGLLRHELAARRTAPDGTTFAYVMCGPQASAQMARDALFAVTGDAKHDVRRLSPITLSTPIA